MKHESVFKKVRKLIDERELGEDNLETAHEDLAELVELDPECGWAYGLLSEIYYWIGEEAEESEDKMFYYNEGVSWGEQGVEADDDAVEANFWLAVNYGSYGNEKGIMKSLSLVPSIVEHAERAIELDESYFYGGPWRVLGRLYNKAPGFPISAGSNKKARECLEKALEFGPEFYLNRLFLAELYLSERQNEKAREHLEWIVNAPLSKNHEREDAAIKETAAKLLEKS